MRSLSVALFLSIPAVFPGVGCCTPMALSFTGELAGPQAVFETSFVLSETSSIRVQTWGFGGGTNAAGTVIPSGGFDPLVALFAGLPPVASIAMQGGDPLADADTLTNFISNCPPAGMVTIGTGAGSTVCGDDWMVASNLPAGTYTLLLTDANYIPLAVNPGPPASTLLSDGFSDLTGGVFQTCNITTTGTACITPSDHYAVDVVLLQGPEIVPVPEPASAWLAAMGASMLAVTSYYRRKNAHN